MAKEGTSRIPHPLHTFRATSTNHVKPSTGALPAFFCVQRYTSIRTLVEPHLALGNKIQNATTCTRTSLQLTASSLRPPASSLEDHKGRETIGCERQQGQVSGGTVTEKTLLMHYS